MARHASLAVIALVLSIVSAAPASAQTLYDRGPPAQRLVYRNLFAFRLNPLGLVHDGRISFRQRLYAHESRALRDNFVGGGIALTHTPAFVRIGPHIEVGPLSVVTLSATLQLVGYYGTFDLFQSFPSARSRFSDDELDRLGGLPEGDPMEPYATTGLECTIGMDVQLKLGPIIVRNRGRLVWANMHMRAGDRVQYDQLNDVLAPDEGFVLATDADVLFQGLQNRFVVGLRYSGTAPLYTDSHFAPGEPHDVNNASHRLGPLVSYSFHIEDGAAFNAPSVFLLAQWWLAHPYRSGQETSAALPLIAVGFQFYGDLLAFD